MRALMLSLTVVLNLGLPVLAIALWGADDDDPAAPIAAAVAAVISILCCAWFVSRGKHGYGIAIVVGLAIALMVDGGFLLYMASLLA